MYPDEHFGISSTNMEQNCLQKKKKKTHHTSNKLKTKILLLLANFRRATFKLEIILISICFIRAQRYKQTNVGELTDGHGVVVFGRK